MEFVLLTIRWHNNVVSHVDCNFYNNCSTIPSCSQKFCLQVFFSVCASFCLQTFSSLRPWNNVGSPKEQKKHICSKNCFLPLFFPRKKGVYWKKMVFFVSINFLEVFFFCLILSCCQSVYLVFQIKECFLHTMEFPTTLIDSFKQKHFFVKYLHYYSRH